MRLAIIAIAALASPAAADKKIVDMTPGFKRELAGCETERNGLQIVVTKTRAFVATDPPDKAELDADLEQVANGHELVVAWCTDARAMVQLLEDNAAAAWKSAGRAVDTQYRVVVKSRKEAKRVLAELAPLTRKLIPRVNARAGEKPPEKKQTGKFPSGRVIAIPAGTWTLGGTASNDVADYAASGITANVTTRPFANATCEQQRRAFVAKADGEVIELDVKPHVGWRYVRRDRTPHALAMICMTSGTGGAIAIADITPATAAADDVTKMMLAMLALR